MAFPFVKKLLTFPQSSYFILHSYHQFTSFFFFKIRCMIFFYFSPLSDLLFNFQSLEAFKFYVQFIKFNGSYFLLVSKKYQFKIKIFSICSSTYFPDLVFMFSYTTSFELIFVDAVSMH